MQQTQDMQTRLIWQRMQLTLQLQILQLRPLMQQMQLLQLMLLLQDLQQMQLMPLMQIMQQQLIQQQLQYMLIKLSRQYRSMAIRSDSRHTTVILSILNLHIQSRPLRMIWEIRLILSMLPMLLLIP